MAARFASVVDQVDDWSAPTPVPEWRALDVVDHLVTWFPAFLAAGGVDLPDGPSSDTDPAGAWRARSAAIQNLLDDPDRAASGFEHPLAGAHQFAEAVDRFYTSDVYMHTWDLARAVGAEPGLDPAFAAELLAGLVEIEDLLRSSGQYGPPVNVATDAPPVERLMAFVGRDPDWAPTL
ncbi:MAG: TIGR03086 family metal-binding protein [Acidimicrobiales bacterium]